MTETPTPPETGDAGDDTTPAEQLEQAADQARARLEDYHPDDDQAADPGEHDTGDG